MATCPKCLGTGEVFIHSKLKECNLCNGKQVVEEDLEEDYIHSIHPFDDD